MKIKALIALMLLAPLVIGSVAYAGDTVTVEQAIDAPEAGERYFGMYGINWFPEKAGKFSKIKRNVNGTKTQVNTPGTYYVNISIPIFYYEDGTQNGLYGVRFCGQSSKGAKTKPVKWKFWASGTQFFSESILWPADEDEHCIDEYFTPTALQNNLLVQVYVKYYNTTHTFTFKRAFALLKH